jgi:hypothetical protein
MCFHSKCPFLLFSVWISLCVPRARIGRVIRLLPVVVAEDGRDSVCRIVSALS